MSVITKHLFPSDTTATVFCGLHKTLAQSSQWAMGFSALSAQKSITRDSPMNQYLFNCFKKLEFLRQKLGLSNKVPHLAMRYLVVAQNDAISRAKDSNSSSLRDLEQQRSLWELDSLIALRLALKQDETQIILYKDAPGSDEGSLHKTENSPYQEILDQIVKAIFRLKLIEQEAMHNMDVVKNGISGVILDRETRICTSLDWNLNQLTGFDFICMLLHVSNTQFDFEPMIKLTCQVIKKAIVTHQIYFMHFDSEYFFMAALKFVAIKKGWE